MEGVAARLGRSSTRYGPAAVFSGPVRRWNKKWVPLSNPDHRRRSSGAHHHGTHLLLYRWTPVSSADGGAADTTPARDSASAAATPQPEEPPRRKFRYVPISVVEEQKQEASPKSNEDIKPNEANQFPHIGQSNPSGKKPDISNVLVEEVQALYKDQSLSEEGNEADLDLSLGLRAPKGDHENELGTTKQGESERASSGQDTETKTVTKPEGQNKLKRKAVSPLTLK